jgi:uncharacterized membrane protein YqaE (UPF0057 family)
MPDFRKILEELTESERIFKKFVTRSRPCVTFSSSLYKPFLETSFSSSPHAFHLLRHLQGPCFLFPFPPLTYCCCFSQILVAIFIPPLGVFLERGCGADLVCNFSPFEHFQLFNFFIQVINICLTILGYM